MSQIWGSWIQKRSGVPLLNNHLAFLQISTQRARGRCSPWVYDTGHVYGWLCYNDSARRGVPRFFQIEQCAKVPIFVILRHF